MSTENDTPVLYDYWRSTASYRVRITLQLASIDYQSISVDLVQGEHRADAHILRNPQGFVPVLVIDGHKFTQSLAIIEYLNNTRSLGLIPDDPVNAARVRALAYALAMDVHPVCNLSVAAYATKGQEPERTQWMQRFIAPGLAAFESLLSSVEKFPFCFSEQPTLAEICLIPQLYNADRWAVDYSSHHAINSLVQACEEHVAFESAAPENVNH